MMGSSLSGSGGEREGFVVAVTVDCSEGKR